jgi:hypothetical protein
VAETTIEAAVEISAAPEPNGFMPATPQAIGSQRIRTTLKADARTEYVAGSLVNASSAYAETLSQYIDPISSEFGVDIYDRMAVDGHIAGETSTLIESAIGQGVRLICRVENEPGSEGNKDGYKKAKAILDFCQENIERIRLRDFLYDMARCCYLGHRVAEIVYIEEGAKLYLDRINVKERYSFAFVVDSRKNVVGIAGNIAGRISSMLTPPTVMDPRTAPNLLPREKFAIATFRPLANDPRGTSIYRPAYNVWWLKQQNLADFRAFLANMGRPPIYGTTAENQPSQDYTDEDGNVSTVTAEVALSQALASLRNGSTLALPFGSTVGVVASAAQTGEGRAFVSAHGLYNDEISKTIVGNKLATNDSKHDARAAAQEGKNVFDVNAAGLEDALTEMLFRDVLFNLVKYNFGIESARKYTPKVSLSAAEEPDLETTAKAFSALKTAGILQKAHLPTIWAKFNLPEVEMDPEPEPIPVNPGTGRPTPAKPETRPDA